MASIVNDPNSRKRILFVAPDGSRKAIRLGKIDRNSAKSICRHVEALLAAQITGQPVTRETAVWLATIGQVLRQRLAAAGLAPGQPAVPSLAAWCQDYLTRQTHVQPASKLATEQAVRNLLEFFGEGRPITAITQGDADDFRKWLLSEGRSHRQRQKPRRLAQATVAKRLQRCRAIFADAQRRGLLPGNPFQCVKLPVATNKERQCYVPATTIEQLIEAAPSAEWRLLLAMARYLGVRVPSEPLSMTWDCVDWARARLRIPSPKTAAYGKSYRIVPLLPQVRPHLETVYEQAKEGSQYVFSQLRQRASMLAAVEGRWAAVNLRQGLLRLLAKCGLRPWPRLWHNLRASAQTDLANRFPAHVVCEWLGNTRDIALRHYLQVTDEHFEQASSGAKSGALEAQKTAQQEAAANSKELHSDSDTLAR